MIEVLWQRDRAFHQFVHLQTGLLIGTRVTNMNDRMTYGELEILADIRVQTHYVTILVTHPHHVSYSGGGWLRFDSRTDHPR